MSKQPLSERAAELDRAKEYERSGAAIRLTVPQSRMLIELSEPMREFQDAWWFTSMLKQRSGDGLVRLGLAMRHETIGRFGKVGYSLTASGQTAAKKLAEGLP